MGEGLMVVVSLLGGWELIGALSCFGPFITPSNLQTIMHPLKLME